MEATVEETPCAGRHSSRGNVPGPLPLPLPEESDRGLPQADTFHSTQGQSGPLADESA